jgi:dTDP-4-dehydrorhamnose 3,5-epimerase
MNVIPTALPEVLILEPTVFRDERGFFFESWNAKTFRQATGVAAEFVQDNHSRSARNVLRGIHFQVTKPQGKLVRVVSGAILDAAVDLRRSSPRFGQWVAVELTADNHRQLWVPPGFGHAFLVQSEVADVLYKTTEYWIREHDRSIRWDDATLAMRWPLSEAPSLSAKDAAAPLLASAELFA